MTTFLTLELDSASRIEGEVQLLLRFLTRLAREDVSRLRLQPHRTSLCQTMKILHPFTGTPNQGGGGSATPKGIFAAGFKAVPEWKSTYFHKRLKLLLTVYVDDFKMSGPKANVKEGWKLLQ